MLNKPLGEMADKVFISCSTVAASRVRCSWGKHNPLFLPSMPVGAAGGYSLLPCCCSIHSTLCHL